MLLFTYRKFLHKFEYIFVLQFTEQAHLVQYANSFHNSLLTCKLYTCMLNNMPVRSMLSYILKLVPMCLCLKIENKNVLNFSKTHQLCFDYFLITIHDRGCLAVMHMFKKRFSRINYFPDLSTIELTEMVL